MLLNYKLQRESKGMSTQSAIALRRQRHLRGRDIRKWRAISERKIAYRQCGLSFREIGSCVGRNQTTVMLICDPWMQEGTIDRHGRSHPPQCSTSHEDRQIVRMTVTDGSVTSRALAQHIESVTHHSVSARTIRRCLQ
ncbi:transposable element Tcb1 transposase [Trichonephila clavipes]|nr:transposable element Tcb1 transposase [Trichonephila clavipes]